MISGKAEQTLADKKKFKDNSGAAATFICEDSINQEVSTLN